MRAGLFLILFSVSSLGACGKLNFDPKQVAQAEFTPQSIGGLQVWLKADSGVTEAGGLVSQWVDAKSSFAFIGVGGGYFPTFQAQSATMGGASSVLFVLGSANRFFEKAVSAPYLCAGTFTQVVIFRPDFKGYFNIATPIDYFRLSNSGSPNNFFIGSVDRGGTEPSYIPKNTTTFANSQLNGSIATPVSSAPMIVIHAQSNVGYDMRLNVASVASWAPLVSYTPDPACNFFSVQVGIGGLVAAASPYPTVEFAEIMLFNWTLGQGEMEQLGCYAKKKYGVSNYNGPCN